MKTKLQWEEESERKLGLACKEDLYLKFKFKRGEDNVWSNNELG